MLNRRTRGVSQRAVASSDRSAHVVAKHAMAPASASVTQTLAALSWRMFPPQTGMAGLSFCFRVSAFALSHLASMRIRFRPSLSLLAAATAMRRPMMTANLVQPRETAAGLFVLEQTDKVKSPPRDKKQYRWLRASNESDGRNRIRMLAR